MTQNGNDRFIILPQNSHLQNGAQEISDHFQKTLKDVENSINRQSDEVGKLRLDPALSVREHEEMVKASLEKAKSYYRKKEYHRAFIEWDKVCAYFDDSDSFRKKVKELKESHEALSSVNRELFQIKETLRQRGLPSSSDARFLEQASQNVTRQIKNGYGDLNQKLRSGRVPKALSFWWPVGAALIILLTGIVFLRVYYSKLQGYSLSGQVDSIQEKALDAAYLQAQRNAMDKQVEALNQDYELKMQELSRKHAEAAKNDRERIIQLETKLRESESKAYDLENQVKALFEDNLNKDNVISSLN